MEMAESGVLPPSHNIMESSYVEGNGGMIEHEDLDFLYLNGLFSSKRFPQVQ